ncbi:MAG: GNAT family N-acetyltransferase [Caulobacterales bacterium]
MTSIGASAWNDEVIGAGAVSACIDAGEQIVAEKDGALVASMLLQWRDEVFWADRDDDAAGYVHRFAVKRAFAHSGATNALMTFASSEALVRGKRFLRLDCAPSPRLCAFYERFGFQRVDTITPHGFPASFVSVRYERALI